MTSREIFARIFHDSTEQRPKTRTTTETMTMTLWRRQVSWAQCRMCRCMNVYWQAKEWREQWGTTLALFHHGYDDSVGLPQASRQDDVTGVWLDNNLFVWDSCHQSVTRRWVDLFPTALHLFTQWTSKLSMSMAEQSAQTLTPRLPRSTDLQNFNRPSILLCRRVTSALQHMEALVRRCNSL
jgi:hypothetical protein